MVERLLSMQEVLGSTPRFSNSCLASPFQQAKHNSVLFTFRFSCLFLYHTSYMYVVCAVIVDIGQLSLEALLKCKCQVVEIILASFLQSYKNTCNDCGFNFSISVFHCFQYCIILDAILNEKQSLFIMLCIHTGEQMILGV